MTVNYLELSYTLSFNRLKLSALIPGTFSYCREPPGFRPTIPDVARELPSITGHLQPRCVASCRFPPRRSCLFQTLLLGIPSAWGLTHCMLPGLHCHLAPSDSPTYVFWRCCLSGTVVSFIDPQNVSTKSIDKFAKLSPSHGDLCGDDNILRLTQGVQFYRYDKSSKHLEVLLLCLRTQLGFRLCRQRVRITNKV